MVCRDPALTSVVRAPSRRSWATAADQSRLRRPRPHRPFSRREQFCGSEQTRCAVWFTTSAGSGSDTTSCAAAPAQNDEAPLPRPGAMTGVRYSGSAPPDDQTIQPPRQHESRPWRDAPPRRVKRDSKGPLSMHTLRGPRSGPSRRLHGPPRRHAACIRSRNTASAWIGDDLAQRLRPADLLSASVHPQPADCGGSPLAAHLTVCVRCAHERRRRSRAAAGGPNRRAGACRGASDHARGAGGAAAGGSDDAVPAGEGTRAQRASNIGRCARFVRSEIDQFIERRLAEARRQLDG